MCDKKDESVSETSAFVTDLASCDNIELPSAETLVGKFELELSDNIASSAEREQILSDLKFGRCFTDYMASATWSRENGWENKKIIPYGNLTLSPAAAILHYGQEVFEGIKAYRHADGSIWTFRPAYNATRFNISAARMAMPSMPVEDFIGSIVDLVRVDKHWVPSAEGSALYLRPFAFADEAFLGVHSAASMRYLCIASPVAGYFGSNSKPLEIWVDKQYHRAGPGGTGFAKTAGNYAAAMLAQEKAVSKGFDQICFLDAVNNKYIEELGGMNLFVVYADGSVKTPKLTGTILEGSTRSAILQLLRSDNVKVTEELIDVADLISDIQKGIVTEVFACGTAAVIVPIGRLVSDDFDVQIQGGDLTSYLYETITGIQFGRLPDKFGWMYKLCD